MKRRGGRVFLLLGLLLIIVVGAVLLYMSQGGDIGGILTAATPTPAPTPLPIDVVVARVDIQPGTVITDTEYYLKLAEMPRPLFDENQHLTNIDSAYNMMISSSVTIFSGTRILRRNLTTPPLSYQIPRGVRGVAVTVDAVSGIGYLLSPGDRVDVILMYEMEVIPEARLDRVREPSALGACTDCPPQTSFTVKTVVQDVPVIKVIDLDTLGRVQGVAPADQVMVVILGMNDQDAEVVKFAEMDPSAFIHLVVRRYDERAPEFTTGITTKLLIETYGLPVPCPIAIDGTYPVFECGGGGGGVIP